jgi:hypothetical protein
MILETTNPKFFQKPQVPAHRKTYLTTGREAEGDHIGESSRSMCRPPNLARNMLITEKFVDRKPNEPPVPISNREPEPRPSGSSLCLFDEAHDAPLWLIIDHQEGCVFARVRGSLAWVVSQMQLAADQLGGKVNDLYYRRAPHGY